LNLEFAEKADGELVLVAQPLLAVRVSLLTHIIALSTLAKTAQPGVAVLLEVPDADTTTVLSIADWIATARCE
jgi:hypothetical protein